MLSNPPNLTRRLRVGLVFVALCLVPFSFGFRGCHGGTVVECESADADGGACVCEYNGKWYADGDSYPSADGCNQCSCNAGQSVCTLKACANSCGGMQDLGCPDGQFCNYPTAASCGAADAPGVCVEPTEDCPKILHWVCGCDGQSYQNECLAQAASTSVAYVGQCSAGCEYEGKKYAAGETFPAADGCNDCTCSEDGSVACTERGCKQCGGWLGPTCDAGSEYCDFTLEDICGFADASGVCKVKPQICTDDWQPVCGCDGKTYSNACLANSSGTGVQLEAECPPAP
jgi:hypothetical protein